MADMTMTETIKAYGLKKMIKYLDDNPDENIPKLMDWMEKLDKKFHIVPGQVAAFLPPVTSTVRLKSVPSVLSLIAIVSGIASMSVM